MKYSFVSRIRYSETDRNGRLTFPAMMDYFQDTSTFHGEDNGLPLSLLYEENIAWVLSGWQVRLFKSVGLNDVVTFTTWAYAFKRSIGLRNYTLRDEAGFLCAVADTQYVLIDIKKQIPTRITDKLISGYTIEANSHINLNLSRKIQIMGKETALEPFAVTEHMIDTNDHVNNSQYIKNAICYLPKDMEFNCFRAEYKRQARLGNVMYPFFSKSGNNVQIIFRDENRAPYFIAEWMFDHAQSEGKYASNR